LKAEKGRNPTPNPCCKTDLNKSNLRKKELKHQGPKKYQLYLSIHQQKEKMTD